MKPKEDCKVSFTEREEEEKKTEEDVHDEEGEKKKEKYPCPIKKMNTGFHGTQR